MKYIFSLIPLSVFAFLIATSTVTLTGCSDILQAGDTVRDTVSLEKLSVPTVDSVEVLAGGKEAKIHFSGSHVTKENFCGYYLLSGNVDNATILQKDSITNGAAWTGDTFFTVSIQRDGIQTFWISSYNKKADRSQAIPAFVFGRNMEEGTVSRFTANSTNDGIDVDGFPEVRSVEDGIRDDANPVKYATNSGCDIIVEQIGGEGTLCITPIGGAVIFKAKDTAIYTKDDIKEIYNASFSDTIKSLTDYNITVYAKGKSVREGSALYPIKADDYFIVITSAKNVARIKVESTDAAVKATFVVYQDSGRNTGELLYKTKSIK